VKVGWDGMDWIYFDGMGRKGHEKKGKGKGKGWVRSRRRVGGEERRGGWLLYICWTGSIRKIHATMGVGWWLESSRVCQILGYSNFPETSNKK